MRARFLGQHVSVSTGRCVFWLGGLIAGWLLTLCCAVGDAQAQPSATHGKWCTVVGSTVPSECTFASPVAACRRQWQAYMSGSPLSEFVGAYGSGNFYRCDWTGFLDRCVGGAQSCGVPLPAGVGFECDFGHKKVDGQCVREAQPEDVPKDKCSQGDPANGNAPTVGGLNPILFLRGAKTLTETDFSTGDGRLSLVRYYHSIPFSFDPSRNGKAPVGLGPRWQFNFGFALSFAPDWPTGTQVTVFGATGNANMLLRNATNALVPWTSAEFPVARRDYEVSFLGLAPAYNGTWPTDLSLMNTTASRWGVVERDGTAWILQTGIPDLLAVGAATPYQRARPVEKMYPSGESRLAGLTRLRESSR
jgi:Domain of unknown function (DUF6531)